jgi:CHAD domain-containing protein
LAAGRCREFVTTDGADEVPQRVAAALEPRFRVVQETRRHTRQVWLDTFDWRLYAAGLVLRQVSGPGGGELVLTTAEGEAVLSQPLTASQGGTARRSPRWPGLLSVIPDGPLRDRLGPVVDVRALLPLARTDGTVTRLRVLDGEMKTVARITVDAGTLTDPGAAALPSRLVVTAVRGYDQDAGRAAGLLGAADGFALDARPAFAAMLAAAGRAPGDYTDRLDVTLQPSRPARQALASVLQRLADVIAANVDFVLRDVDTEFLHDLRVAVRRTRSALKLAGDVLPGDMAARFAPEFKWLGDLTTPVRDLDVYLSGFGELTARLSAAEPADLDAFRTHLAGQRAVERRRLARGLRSDRFGTLMADWRAALDQAKASRMKRPDTATLAAERIARAYRRVAKRGAAITAASPAEEMHALRKRGKELRYLLEIFGSLYEPAALRRGVKDLKGLQDCLGDFQDAEVQRLALREFAIQMATRGGAPQDGAGLAATLLAMGELTAQLHAQQVAAQAEVAGRFAAFTRAESLRTLGVLPAAAGS